MIEGRLLRHEERSSRTNFERVPSMSNPNALLEAVRRGDGVSRRVFLAYGAAMSTWPWFSRDAQAASPRRATFSTDPFTLGVASGDPDSTGVVLWTRLAPR